MNTAVVEIKNDAAYGLLKNLEQLQVIRIIQTSEKKDCKQKRSERFAGCLSNEQVDEMQKELIQMREEYLQNQKVNPTVNL